MCRAPPPIWNSDRVGPGDYRSLSGNVEGWTGRREARVRHLRNAEERLLFAPNLPRWSPRRVFGMRFRLFLPLAGVLLGAVACLGGSGAGDVSKAPGASEVTPGPIDSPSEPTDLAWIYDAPYAPLNLTTTLDESGMAEAVIPVEGGTRLATGAEGTTYTLAIPGWCPAAGT